MPKGRELLEKTCGKFDAAVASAERNWSASIKNSGETAVQQINASAAASQKAVNAARDKVAAVVSARMDAQNETARKLSETAAKLEARQLWSAAAAMCLTLLPVATVLAGLWMTVSALIGVWRWAQDVEGDLWLGIGLWNAFAAGLTTVSFGLFWSGSWVSGFVGTWKHPGTSSWPRRR